MQMLPWVLPKLSATCDNFGKAFAEPVALLRGPSYQKGCKKTSCCWEFIIEHVHYINFGTRDSFTYVIFGSDIEGSVIIFVV